MGHAPTGRTEQFHWFSRPLHEIYPPYSEQAMKERVRIRDLQMCRDCSMTQEEHMERYGESLPVHHIHGQSTVDDTNRSHVLTNLITLCSRCHQFWDPLPAYLQIDAFIGPYLDYPVLKSPASTQYRQLQETINDYGSLRVARSERHARPNPERASREGKS